MPRSAVALARLASPAPAASDAQLLRSFTASQGDDAFAELVRRHGPMVLAVCRRMLSDTHDAEDAFQATFLVLARKAGSVRGTNVAGWLYGVAVRTARGVRVMRDRRRKHSERGPGTRDRGQESGDPAPDTALVVTEQAAIIDEELTKLPAHLRAAIVACEVRGLSRKQAAAELDIPEGTLSSRLAAAKRKLAERLSARGLAGAVVLAAALAPATVSAVLLESTALTVRGAAGSVAGAAASAVMKGMLFDQLRALVLVGAVLVAGVCAGLGMTGPAEGPPGKAVAPAPRPVEDPAAMLVKQLASEDFATRESAEKELRKLGPKAERALKAGLKSEDPEIRARCAKILAEVRKDALDALVKTFDPAAENQPDHPIWTRFKAIAGNTGASRELFARILKNAEWLRRLDAAETGPEAAAVQYREAILEVGRRYHSCASVSFRIYVWPCDTAVEVVYLLFLGSFTGTETAQPPKDPDANLYSGGESRIHYARGLELALAGEEIAPGPLKDYDATAALPADSNRVFAKLLAAWLVRRTDKTVLFNGFDRAVKHRAAEVLPAARKVAGDEKRGADERCGALRAVAQFGTPAADLPLFAALFDDRTAIILAPPPTGKSPGPRSRRLAVHDSAVALALLLCDQDPFEYGFAYAKGRFQRDNGRPLISGYEAESFGFPDEDARTAAHTKAKAFLAKQKTKNEFEEQVKKIEAEVKKLGLVEVATNTNSFESKHPVQFDGKAGAVRVALGSAVLVELPEGTRVLKWNVGGGLPEDIGEKNGPVLSHVLCKWSEKGTLTFALYRVPAGKGKGNEKPDPVATKLVEQLGSADFAEREAAEKELRKLGAKARTALEAGLKSEVPEVRDRCAKVLTEIRKGALDDLTKNFDPKADVVPDHPLWTRFKTLAGDTPASRELFAQVLADARLARRLEAAEANPADRAGIYRDEVAWQSCNATYVVANQFPGGYHMLEGGPRATELKPPPEPITPARLAAYFFLGSYPETTVDVPGKDRAGRPVREWLMVETAAFSSTGDPSNTIVRKLFAAWLNNRVDGDTLESGYWRATADNIPDAVSAARRLLAAEKLPSPAKASAALYLARCGKRSDVPLIEPLLTDTTVARKVTYDWQPAPVQVRDAALSACLLLHGESPADYGFDILRKRSDPKADAFSMAWLGFHTDESRTAAHKKGKAFLDKQKEEKKEKPDPDPVKLVEQLGSADFAEREAAQKQLRELGAKAETALKAGLKSEQVEVRYRCGKLLDQLRADRLAAPDSPVWQKFKAVAGDTEEAKKLYQRVTGTARRGEMLLAAVADPKAAAASYEKECDEIATAVKTSRIGGPPLPKPPGPEVRDATADDIAALLFLGTLPRGGQKQLDKETVAVHSGRLRDGLRGETKAAFARLYAAWAEPRPEYYASSLSIGLEEGSPALAGVARKALAVKDRPLSADLKGPALRYLGLRGTSADVPLVIQFADDTTECGRIEFSKIPGGALGPWRPAMKNTDVVAQVRDVAVIAALELHKKRPQDFGFEQDIVQDGGPPPGPHWLGHLGFCSDADRVAAHKKAREWLDKQKEPKKEEPKPDPVKLVEQLGSADFAEREAAEKALKEFGSKARPALEAGLKSESAEVVKRCRDLLDHLARAEFEALHWARFAQVIGDDKASRALFDRIRSQRRNVELLDAVAADPKAAGKLYHDRWKELNKAAHIPTGVGSSRLVDAPLADVVGWMYLGTFPGAEGAFHTSYSLDFLPRMPPGKTARDELRDALKDKTLSAPFRRLIGKWTAARVDYTGRDFGLQSAIAYDIQEVLPAARETLTAKVKDDPYPGNTARNVGLAMLVVGKLGSKDDLPLLEKYAADEGHCAAFLNDPPLKPGEPRFLLLRLPVEGQDATAQLRDVSAAMRLRLLGENPDDYGFHWRWPHEPNTGKPTGFDPFYLNGIGFLRDADREAAHKKAKEWLNKQK
jgi:RNA polymerase sigma factor (sigma-70 family)